MCENLPGVASHMSPLHAASRLSYPSCEDLGIPYVDFPPDDGVHGDVRQTQHRHLPPGVKANKMMSVNGMKYDVRDPNNPFSPYCRIPLPSPFGTYEYGFEPAFIRKRNERERERVRCVNEGYHRLRQHLPMENKDKRISKVETLRCAISYIEHLQNLLGELDNTADEHHEQTSRKRRPSDETAQDSAKRARYSD